MAAATTEKATETEKAAAATTEKAMEMAKAAAATTEKATETAKAAAATTAKATDTADAVIITPDGTGDGGKFHFTWNLPPSPVPFRIFYKNGEFFLCLIRKSY